MKFRPSAAAINPITKDIWVVSSTNDLIVVIDRKGNMKDVYTLESRHIQSAGRNYIYSRGAISSLPMKPEINTFGYYINI